MVYANGQTQETSRRFDEGDVLDQRKGLGRIQTSSRSDGVKPFRPHQVDSSKKNSLGRTNQYRDIPPGKIIERLKFIEGRYLSHLKTLQQQLEHKLDETKGEEEDFKTAIQELEQEIYNLVSSQELLESPTNEISEHKK
ncbi:hypothetical protein [Nostoc sp.]|uniref:hypothetical protein n=1 Tax=Nostoc sp. TaxID=1180 RepID=UPI002FF91ED1